jgi:hypothetical protein
MLLMLASAVVIIALGVAHLVYTFYGSKLRPRDASLLDAMRKTSPMITRQTTMWKAWVGFNASHGMGAMLFGLIYCYLVLMQPALLFQSTFLLAVGFAMLAGYFVLAKRYWFSLPFKGICMSAVFYIVAIVLSRVPI